MSEQQGYWDVNRCAWVGATPTYVLPPAAGPADDDDTVAAD